ncbi:unnamed protein product [Brachionus calyciflorus]|uniref:Reverse transcriptase/retrotransposon-derived protein RNase H-like domain-containing protein n=1 Tax=Brachionus calyciflorus TaxID=104777 RepID=A0A813V4B4_9BILA|nr:unnamed protein product [Brachionus calyciflorus]
MNKKTILTITIALILVQFNQINCLKCFSGFGLTSKSSGPTAYNYDNTSPQLECSGTLSTNPLYQPKGCYKFVHKLSDGNEYVEKGCFTGATSLSNLSPNYDGKTKHFSPKDHKLVRIANFRKIAQHMDEPVYKFVERLREAASECEFSNVDDEIINQIIDKTTSDALKTHLALTENLDLKKVLRVGSALETLKTSTQNKKEKLIVSIIKQIQVELLTVRKFRSYDTCGHCGHEYPHINRACPALNHTCSICKKHNHFESADNTNLTTTTINAIKPITTQDHFKKSQSTQTQLIKLMKNWKNSSEDDIENIFSLDQQSSKRKCVSIQMFNDTAPFLVDTGTTLNVIDQVTFESLDFDQVIIEPCTTRVYGYGSSQLKMPNHMLGIFSTNVKFKNKHIETRFAISKGHSGCILSLETLEALEIISITLSMNDEFNKYPSLFSGKVGKFKDIQVKLHVNHEVKSVRRRIPFHLRDRVEAEIQRLLDMDIIEPASGPTPWVSLIVVVPKPGQPDKIRICTDACLPNQAIARERHVTPTVEDIIIDLNALREAGTPKNASELRSFLGLATYVARFIEDYETISEPLWRLTKSNIRWHWNNTHKNAFEKVKESITTKAMAHFDKTWDTMIIVDASPVGLGAILMQTNSCDPNDTRIIMFITVTDNNAVELIFNNQKSNPPARIQRWCLRLSQYDFTIVHKPSKYNPADYLSRNPIDKPTSHNPAEEYVLFWKNELGPPVVKKDKLPILQKLTQVSKM